MPATTLPTTARLTQNRMGQCRPLGQSADPHTGRNSFRSSWRPDRIRFGHDCVRFAVCSDRRAVSGDYGDSTGTVGRSRSASADTRVADGVRAASPEVRTTVSGTGDCLRKVKRPMPSEHLPLRPLWLCRRCGQPWPCGPARLALVSEYRDDRVSLFLYLAGLLHEAIEDLHRLNPSTTGDVPDLFDRFLGWPIRPQA